MKLRKLAEMHKSVRCGRDLSKRRFFTRLDMAILKQDIDINRAMVRRGEIEIKGGNEVIYECGCGMEGCFIHSSFRSYTGTKRNPNGTFEEMVSRKGDED
jgi:hypothetical protein